MVQSTRRKIRSRERPLVGIIFFGSLYKRIVKVGVENPGRSKYLLRNGRVILEKDQREDGHLLLSVL